MLITLNRLYLTRNKNITIIENIINKFNLSFVDYLFQNYLNLRFSCKFLMRKRNASDLL